MRLPELILKQLVDELLDLITSDYNNAPTEEDTFLYQVFEGNVLKDYDFYKQAQAIFLRTSDDPRKLETRMMFDATRAELPTIHVVLPSETIGKDNSIGMNRSGDNFVRSDGSLQPLYGRSFDIVYQLAITSGNPFETVLIYQGLKAGLISITDSLELNGLKLPNLSGNDLNIDSNLMPNIYTRALAVEIDFDFKVPSMTKHKVLNKINFEKSEIHGE